LTSEDD
jgi:hypothetical protein